MGNCYNDSSNEDAEVRRKPAVNSISDNTIDELTALTLTVREQYVEIQGKNQKIDGLQTTLIEKDKKISELKTKQEQLLNSQRKSLEQCTTNENQLNDKNNEIEELNAMFIDIEKEMKEKDTQIHQLTTKENETDALFIDIEKDLKDKDDKLNHKSQEIEQLNAKINELKDKNQQFDQLKAAQNKVKHQLSIKENKLNQKNQQIVQLNDKIKELATIIKELKNKNKFRISKRKNSKKSKKKYQADDCKRDNNNVNGTAGLNNLGNTCWMNSILQCTSHLPALIEYFNRNKMNGNVSTAFQKIITDIWRNDSSSMPNSLRIFKSKMSSVSSKYGSYNEQDPAEFLDYLINVLHDELNIADDEYANNDVIVGNGLPDFMVSKLSWTAYLKKHNSPIIELFYGQHKSNIICANKQCKYDYVIFEPFKMLAVATTLKYIKQPTLYDCIDQYTQKNVLDKSKWHCSKCKQDLPNAIEQVQLYKFPKILVIHLKKLQMQSISAQPFIHYPVNGLNLKQYDISNSKQEYIYDLFAVSCLSGHHCIAYAKNHINKQWFRFSDSYVSKVEEKEVVVRNAYLLFYQSNLFV